MTLFLAITDSFAFFLGVIGGIIIIVGALKAVWGICLAWLSKRNKKNDIALDFVRLDLGRHILLGLEFFIGKDIIETIFIPSWNEIGILGALILIRTILTYFLTKEINQIERHKLEHRRIDARMR